MEKKQHVKPYPIRFTEGVGDWVREQAKVQDRSINYVVNKMLEQVKEASEQKQTA
ncbi:hypothetical protein [Thiothrix fructosivorans]|uniref:Arc-like DNA binding domain-containing protein n=1 Tax=Thiothrix fructosivorans TaxID=111770 RepID=A0A8B0SNT2_9GAMM|nr:hypothetical protein [Thiothrix fructosivorans]MBO0611782.1 hypothetical protein [Thiothrix fructosivorans]QTX10562.1 hypothetical protein J1836_018655 [Thiothrix fructosivorans]